MVKPPVRVPLPIVFYVMALAFIWGGNSVAIKIGLSSIPPFAGAGIRFSIAIPIILIWALVRKIRILPHKAELPRLLILGVVFAAQIAIVYVGIDLTHSGRASIFLNGYPIYVAALAHFFVPGDRLSPKSVFGLAIALAGLLTVFGSGNASESGSTLVGDSLVLVSGFLLAVLIVMINRIAQETDPERLLIAEMIVGVAIFFVLSALFEREEAWSFNLRSSAALLYQGVIVGSFAFVSWATILKHYPPARISVIFFSSPLWGVLLSIVILDEPFSARLLLGGVLVATGIILVNRRKRAKRRIVTE